MGRKVAMKETEAHYLVFEAMEMETKLNSESTDFKPNSEKRPSFWQVAFSTLNFPVLYIGSPKYPETWFWVRT